MGINPKQMCSASLQRLRCFVFLGVLTDSGGSDQLHSQGRSWAWSKEWLDEVLTKRQGHHRHICRAVIGNPENTVGYWRQKCVLIFATLSPGSSPFSACAFDICNTLNKSQYSTVFEPVKVPEWILGEWKGQFLLALCQDALQDWFGFTSITATWKCGLSPFTSIPGVVVEFPTKCLC